MLLGQLRASLRPTKQRDVARSGAERNGACLSGRAGVSGEALLWALAMAQARGGTARSVGISFNVSQMARVTFPSALLSRDTREYCESHACLALCSLALATPSCCMAYFSNGKHTHIGCAAVSCRKGCAAATLRSSVPSPFGG